MNTLVWVDLETTGLDARKDDVLEIACVVTDGKFNELGCWSAVVLPDVADPPWETKLDFVVREMHTVNGLLALVPNGMFRCIADKLLKEWLTLVIPMGEKPQLAGSTIDFDRAFLRAHFPGVSSLLHYRNLDVSTLNEMARRNWPEVYEGRPRGTSAHRAMTDIAASLETARYYSRALSGTPSAA